ncbi:putative cis-zeatin O-glucosyltransferase [Setaria italica]|uniref:Glycosyltransferase n=2 Tax=Setaria italica TaxID=4555 RepID=K3Y749_SETIT|nr:putative cis-zeatin O-glucosyltransferase [Setaria italica]
MSMESVAVVAVPFPAQGHLNQLLHLSLQLAALGLPVHYAAPAEHVRQARARVHGWGDDALRRVRFHDLAISGYVSPRPDPAAVSPFPSHLMPLWEAFTASAAAPVAALLREASASHRRVVVLYDPLNGFVAEEAARLPNGEAYALHCTAVSSIVGRMEDGNALVRERGLGFLPLDEYVTEEFLEYAIKRARAEEGIASPAGLLANSCRALEGEFIDFLAEQMATGGKKLFAIGPLNPLLGASAPEHSSKRHHECLDWLDEQPPASVLYVSFGSMSSLPREQIVELAAALRGSHQRFIWVLRDADRGNIFADNGETQHARLLAEFTKQTDGRGLVVTGWAPQLEILAHPATAAFMSHCGWNSTMESMSYGKPILAWPMHSDQPWDAELVCEYLGAGFLVRPCEKQTKVTPAATIQPVIERMMVSDEGRAARQRAAEVGEAVRASAAAGGSSRKDFEDFIAHITR